MTTRNGKKIRCISKLRKGHEALFKMQMVTKQNISQELEHQFDMSATYEDVWINMVRMMTS